MTRSADHDPGGAAGFVCEKCRRAVPPVTEGTHHRNHCPGCLWSLHVDLRTGDRRSGCRGLMEPIASAVERSGEWALVHRCERCRLMRINRVAGDDDGLVLVSLAVRPLARPPFPLSDLNRSDTR